MNRTQKKTNVKETLNGFLSKYERETIPLFEQFDDQDVDGENVAAGPEETAEPFFPNSAMRTRIDYFKTVENQDVDAEVQKKQESESVLAVIKEILGKNNLKRDRSQSVNLEDIIKEVSNPDWFLCVNGEVLLMKEGNEYTPISQSTTYAIMRLKEMLPDYFGIGFRLSNYEMIIKELKTEPNIWVREIRKAGNGQYNIVLRNGKELPGVIGEFEDFLVYEEVQAGLKPFSEGIAEFIKECCIIDAELTIKSREIYDAYREFLEEHPSYLPAKINQFVPFVKKRYGLQSATTGKARILKGVSLKKE